MSLTEAREKWRTMTGEQYMAYLESLMEEPSAPALKVVSARELIRGRPPTAEEQAADDAVDARLAAKGALEDAEEAARERTEDAEEAARERITNLHGEKAARAFDAFRVIEASEFASEADTEPAWQMRGVVPKEGTGLHPGPSSSLKSFVEFEIGACINRGVPFHGRQVTKGRAVIVCAEGAQGYKRRLRAYARHHKVPLTDLPAIIPAAPNLFEPAQITALIERLKLLGATYVCLDTKWRCSAGADENSANDQLIVLGSMDRIARELGCFVMAVTHTGRDAAKGARGSSSQYAAVDVELTQERTGDYCTLRVSKMRDSEDDAKFMFKAVRVDLGFNQHGEPESSLVLEPAEATAAAVPGGKMGKVERAIIDYVRASGETQFTRESLVDDLHESLKVRRDNLKRVLKKLTGSLFEADGDDLTLRAGIVHDNTGWLA